MRREGNVYGVCAHEWPPRGARMIEARLREIHAARATVRCEETQVIAGAAAAVEDTQVAATTRRTRDDGRHELPEAAKPEV